MAVAVGLRMGALTLTMIGWGYTPLTKGFVRTLDGAGDAPLTRAAGRTTREMLGGLPQRFEGNRGQFAPEVRYMARADGYDLYLTDTESVLVLYRSRGEKPKDGVDHTTLRMKIRGAGRPAHWEPGRLLPGVSNYIHGNNPSRWQRDVPAYESVTARQVQPGVDLVWYGKDRKLEYDLVVAPGVDPASLEVAWEGAHSMTVDRAGNLVLETIFGRVMQQRPFVYQVIGGRKVKIEARYSLRPGSGARFALGRYDRTRPVVIDPAVMVYSTFLGSSATSGTAVVADAAGSVYLTGQSLSASFPFVNPFRTAHAINEIFLAKFNPAGTALVYATYLGGSGEDLPTSLAVDNAGSAYLLGESNSTDFPVRSAIQGTRSATAAVERDATLTKFTAAGNDLVYSTYFGGTGGTAAAALSVAADGSVYFGAYIKSGTLTVTPAPQVLNTSTGGRAILAKVRPAGSSFEWLSALGDIVVTDVASDSTGVYFGANNYLRPAYPAVNAPPGLVQTRSNEGILGKLNPGGSAFVYYTHFGGGAGGEDDKVWAIAIDSTGALYAAGATTSSDLPLQNPLRTYTAPPAGLLFQDGFALKLSPAGNSILYSTYIGGRGRDSVFDIGVDNKGGLAMIGETLSSDLVQVESLQPNLGGVQDAFVMKLKPGGNAIQFSTFLGSLGEEVGYGLFSGSAGALYVTRVTTGPSTFPTLNAFQGTQAAGFSAFLTKYTATSQTPAVGTLSPTATSGTQQSFTFSFTDPDGATDLGVVNVLINNFLNGERACYIAFDLPSNFLFLVNDVGDGVTALPLSGSGTTSNGQCTIVGAGSSATVSGNTLTLTLVIQFNATTFSGRKVVYLAARDSDQNNSGWQPMGTYSVGAAPATNPMVVSLTPNSGTTNSATLTVSYRDAAATTNLQATQILINSALDGAAACYVPYFVPGNLLLLVPDNGDAGQSAVMSLTSGGTLENSQCRVESVGSSRSDSGNLMTLTVRLTFKAAFRGRKIIYGGVQTGAGGNSNWHAMGAWVVP
ncbi:MAG: SBBP repeat-containing protein [Acidobacteria bacterium]|nr:SBBP repeat-containing protein [Bryobacteraceae bacterium CoA2 C42]